MKMKSLLGLVLLYPILSIGVSSAQTRFAEYGIDGPIDRARQLNRQAGSESLLAPHGALIENADNGSWLTYGGLDNGCAGQVEAQAVAANGDLYVGGYFSVCGDVEGNSIARWDGARWTALGTDSSLGFFVSAIAFSGTDVYAVGDFHSVGGVEANLIARWDGTTWSPLGTGLTSSTGGYTSGTSMTIVGDDIYVGGYFDRAGGIPANGIARWNITSQTWYSLGSGAGGVTEAGQPAQVNAIAVFNSQIVVGGRFDSAGGQAAKNVAGWNGTSWSSFANGVSGQVSAIAADASQLYIGGAFTSAGSTTVNRIARWDGTAWTPLISGGVVGTNRAVLAMVITPDGLYVGGQFTQAGGVGHAYIARWSGGTWHAVGGGFESIGGTSHVVRSLAYGNGRLHAGGAFNRAGSTAANFIATWDGSTWAALDAPPGNGFGTLVSDAAAYKGQSCYTGYYPPRNGMGSVVCWNGTGWQPLTVQASLVDVVDILYSAGQDLYVGGFNIYASGSCCIGRWDGMAWYGLGNALQDQATAILVDGNDVYVSSFDLTIGGVPNQGIGRWDGVNWNAMGGGLGEYGFAKALVKYNGRIIAAGRFTNPGGISAANIAAWNGSSWESLGSGLNNEVNALKVLGGRLYAGGYFDQAGGIAANSLAVWDGSAWSAVEDDGGNGVGFGAGRGTVMDLEASESALFIGGLFDRAGNVHAKGLARFDGTRFTSLGGGSANGVSSAGYVTSLALRGAVLQIGGIFGSAGGSLSSNVAEYTPDQIMSSGSFE